MRLSVYCLLDYPHKEDRKRNSSLFNILILHLCRLVLMSGLYFCGFVQYYPCDSYDNYEKNIDVNDYVISKLFSIICNTFIRVCESHHMREFRRFCFNAADD